MAQAKTQKKAETQPAAPEPEAKAETQPAAPEAAAELVPMVREEPMFTGGPTTSNVHPDEVANMKAAGWREAD